MALLDRNAGNYDYAQAKKEADTIIVSVIVGFAATRALLGQPFSYDMQDTNDPNDDEGFARDVARWEMALDALAHVIGGLRPLVAHNVHADNLRPEDISNATEGGINPTSGEISNAGREHTITGRPGGDALPTGIARWRRPWMNLIENPNPEYWGRGAYTGVCDDPLRVERWLNPSLARPNYDSIANANDRSFANHLLLVPEVARIARMPTLTVKIAPAGGMGRYKPTNPQTWYAAKGVDNNSIAYGEIHISNEQPPPEGLSLAFNGDRLTTIVGYVHGMSQAQVESTKRGPWCVAHEHAIGTETTKLASCFACTTYMYAAGFPPSSCHLGRGESWVPPVPDPNNAGAAALATSINSRWHSQVFYYLVLGARLLRDYFAQDGLRHPYNDYAPIAAQLLDTLARNYGDGGDAAMIATYDIGRIVTSGGNLFLDALVHHDSDSTRLFNVLGLTEIDVEDLADYQAHLYAHVEQPREAQIAAAKQVMRDLRYYPPAWMTKQFRADLDKRKADDKKRREAERKALDELAATIRQEELRRRAEEELRRREEAQREQILEEALRNL